MSSDDGGQHPSPHNDEQPPPENHIVEPTGGEKEMSGPSTVKLPSGTSNAPSQPHQDDAFNDSPNDFAPPEAAGVVVQQSDLIDLKNIMNKVLDVLQDSNIASKGGKDVRSRFWTIHKRVAEEHDGEFLERYSSDMDIVLVFSGLFSAVSTTFIVAMESSLSPDPSDTTNALLTQLVQIGLGNLAAGAEPATSPWSPSTSNVRIQAIAYASLCMSLLAAFGAVLGKQWLGYYKASRYGRGSPEERGKRRQEKFSGTITWYFDAVLQSFPVLLQLSLLLFGIALSANMWYQPHSIAWVIIATTVFGFLFYSLTLMAALVSPTCPFQTPISTILRILHVDRVLRPMVKPALRYFQWLMMPVHSVLHVLRTLYEALEDHMYAVCSFAWRCLQSLFGALHIFVHWLRSFVVRSPAHVKDSEAQSPDRNLGVSAKDQSHLGLRLPDISTNDLEAPSIKWLLETSTDPEVIFAAASLVPLVEWPLDLDVSDMLHQLYDIYESCLDAQSRIVPSLEEKASACTMALSHLYYGCALQAYTDNGCFGDQILSRSRSYGDSTLFRWMIEACKAHDNVLGLTAKFSGLTARFPGEDYSEDPIEFAETAPEWLSHILPYHFVVGRVDNEDLEKLAIAVISTLLSPSSSPSTQILANCTLLACVMIGVQFDMKDIVRIDKSSALPRLTKCLWEQFQTTLWDDLDGDSIVRRRVCNPTDVICCIFQFRQPLSPPSDLAWKLDLCRKIYSRAMSSEQKLAALRRVRRFRFDIVPIDWTPNRDDTWWWKYHVPLRGNSHSPEDFDWLVDYFDAVYSNDLDTACDILVLMSSMSVSCSPAKQHLFIERLIACMDSSMPHRLRHFALRAAHSSREVLTSIDAVDDDADMVLTKLSPAIMSAVCPRPGTTPADDGPDRLFNYYRDLCYLRLVFALARNPIWHPHLVGDHHIDCCISMIAYYFESSFRVEHPCYLLGILLRVAPEQVSVTSLWSITKKQWWDTIICAWVKIFDYANVKDMYYELLPVLVEVTEKYMQIAFKSDLEQLIQYMDLDFGEVEQRGLEWIDDVKKLKTIARGKISEVRSIVIRRETFD